MASDLKILIIDSDPLISSGLERKAKDQGFNSCYTVEPDERIAQFGVLNPDMAILGPSLEIETTLKCIYKLKIIDPLMPVLTSCDHGRLSIDPACAPFEGIHYISPDPDGDEISRIIQIAFKQKVECDSRSNAPVLIGQSNEIRGIRQKILNVSDKDINILITGESGTGKELIARSIHHHSHRSNGPLVKVDCGTLPDDLLESEVFGFQKGAFTGAHRDKPGRLEIANRGTLFIDEIGVLSLSLQAKFLQVLEDKSFSRLGGTQDKIIDIRVVAATNTDLWEKVREGTFREDLFYRLNVVHIKAPPLRDKEDDIPLLSYYFMNKYCFEFKKELLDIPDMIADLFLAYHWPGNVRELENVIRRAIVLRDWDFVFKELKLEDKEIKSERNSFKDTNRTHLEWDDEIKKFFNDTDFSLKKITRAYVSEKERKEILKALRVAQWNRKIAAQLLRISYKTLLNRIQEFDLQP